MRMLSRLSLTAPLLAAMLGMNAAIAQEQPEEPPGMMQGQGMMPMNMMMQMSRMMEACTDMMQTVQPAPATPQPQPQPQPQP